ncbi:hypothetical protein D7024_11440 [Desulfofundulus salinus]|uniref:Uncharacterized protein n=1 Tax=Desulfofundulus salinus TaxID=2419843 RepID=A0A494X3M0_9FIRM|nr:hypothetical protein D7024_11440 [Desulfofundulus salinum]
MTKFNSRRREKWGVVVVELAKALFFVQAARDRVSAVHSRNVASHLVRHMKKKFKEVLFND